MSRYAVIASNSFSGGHFLDLLLRDPTSEVIGISRSPEKSDLFLPYKKWTNANFTYYALDLNTHFSQITECLNEFKPEFVINFAAQGEVGTSWKWPEQWFQTNTLAIARLGNFLRGCSYLKRYLHISTPEVYGTCEGNMDESVPLNPSTPYAASKAAGDLALGTYVKQYGFPMITIRSTNVYGAHQQLYRIIPRTIIYLKQGKKIQLHGGGKAYKAYIHIRDVCDGILRALKQGHQGEVYHLSPPNDISIRDLVRQVCRIMGYDFDIVTESIEERPGQDARYAIDSSKARRELGWFPKIPLQQGIQEVIDWIEDNWDRIQKEPLEYIHQS